MNNINPCIWKILHIFSRTMSIKNIEAFDYFISAIIILHPNKEYSNIMKSYLEKEPIEHYSTSSDVLFYWVYSFRYYVEKRYNGIDIDSYDEILEEYRIDRITKPFWGNPLWILIHYYSIIADNNDFYIFKSLIYTLTKLMPCPKCKAHLVKNLKLQNMRIDKYKNNLFLFTFNLHNIVNKSIKKEVLNYQEAKEIYGVN
jgi:hypothetical protein